MEIITWEEGESCATVCIMGGRVKGIYWGESKSTSNEIDWPCLMRSFETHLMFIEVANAKYLNNALVH